jgi:hypothetical protein
MPTSVCGTSEFDAFHTNRIRRIDGLGGRREIAVMTTTGSRPSAPRYRP